MNNDDRQYYTLRDIILAAASQWKLFSSALAAGILLSFIALSSADKVYEASVMIAKPDQESRTGALSRFSSLGGIASGLLGSGGGRFDFLDVLRSLELAEALNEHHNLDRVLYGGLWDDKAQRWDMGRLPFSAKLRRWLRGLINLPVPDQISAWDIQKWLAEGITITQTVDRTAWTLRLRNRDPKRAISVLEKLVQETELILVDRRRAQINLQIKYYFAQLETLRDEELRTASISSLARLQQERIILDSGVPYGAKIIYGPQVTDFPVSPAASKFIIVGVFLSGMLAFIVSTVVGLIRRK